MRGIFFLKNCVARFYCVVVMILHADMYVYLFMAIQHIDKLDYRLRQRKIKKGRLGHHRSNT